MNWFDRVILGKSEDKVAERVAAKTRRTNRNARPARQSQVGGDNAAQTQIGSVQTDFAVEGSEKAKAFIKVYEVSNARWAYEVTVIYKGEKQTYNSQRVMGARESLYTENDTKRYAEARARSIAKELRIKAEPKVLEFELEI
jgi:hypothetical protein